MTDSSNDEGDEEFFAAEALLREKGELMAQKGIISNEDQISKPLQRLSTVLNDSRKTKSKHDDGVETNAESNIRTMRKRIKEIMDESGSDLDMDEVSQNTPPLKVTKKKARIIESSDLDE